jgi:hypothetical protein
MVTPFFVTLTGKAMKKYYASDTLFPFQITLEITLKVDKKHSAPSFAKN